MNIERYFERGDGGELLARGTRVDVATILHAYRDGLSPEEIAYNFPTVPPLRRRSQRRRLTWNP